MKHYATLLVTGGAGYIGRHAVKALLDAGYFPVVLDNSLPRYGLTASEGIQVNGYIEDKKLLSSLFSQYDFDAVMHIAAYPESAEATMDPIKYHRNNLYATMVLVESMLNFGVKRLIFTSSAAVYGEPHHMPVDEAHPCQPMSRHGESKYFVEKVLEDCRVTHGLEYITLRHFSVAGYNPHRTTGISGRKNADLITNMIDAAAGFTPAFSIFGTDYDTSDGTCIRDYVHVDDLADAYVAALERVMNGGSGGVYNVGSGRGYSVKQVLEKVQTVTGRKIPSLPMDRRAGDPAVLIADATKIRSELGWQPRFGTLEDIIETAWVWYQKSVVPN
jgi:UDP-glucose-4-epimerase GalE